MKRDILIECIINSLEKLISLYHSKEIDYNTFLIHSRLKIAFLSDSLSDISSLDMKIISATVLLKCRKIITMNVAGR